MARTTSPISDSGLRRRRRAVVSAMSDSLHATSKKRLRDAGEQHDHDEQDDGDGGSISETPLPPEDLREDEEREGRGRPRWSAVRHHERELEHLERPDQRERDAHRGGRGEQGPFDRGESAPAGGSI